MLKKGVLSVVAGLLVIFVYTILTVPVIEKHTKYGDVIYVGGEFSHADIMFVDHRPAFEASKEASHVWWGTKDGEWRRLGYLSYDNRWYTQAVLRDIAYPGSHFGVGRGTREFNRMQTEFNAVRTAYERQFVFNRVWVWRVQRFR